MLSVRLDVLSVLLDAVQKISRLKQDPRGASGVLLLNAFHVCMHAAFLLYADPIPIEDAARMQCNCAL